MKWERARRRVILEVGEVGDQKTTSVHCMVHIKSLALNTSAKSMGCKNSEVQFFAMSFGSTLGSELHWTFPEEPACPHSSQDSTGQSNLLRRPRKGLTVVKGPTMLHDVAPLVPQLPLSEVSSDITALYIPWSTFPVDQP